MEHPAYRRSTGDTERPLWLAVRASRLEGITMLCLPFWILDIESMGFVPTWRYHYSPVLYQGADGECTCHRSKGTLHHVVSLDRRVEDDGAHTARRGNAVEANHHRLEPSQQCSIPLDASLNLGFRNACSSSASISCSFRSSFWSTSTAFASSDMGASRPGSFMLLVETGGEGGAKNGCGEVELQGPTACCLKNTSNGAAPRA